VAQQVETRLVDDLDGSEADETVTFALEGRQYEIDLSADNAAKLRDALAAFVGVARRGDGGRRRSPAPRAARPAAGDREHTAAVREWARQNGHQVSDRGRIPNAVIEAYEQRDSSPAVVVEEPAPRKKRRSALKVTDPFTVQQEVS
jgi:hypothetical protein